MSLDLLEEIGERICGGQNKKNLILLYKTTTTPDVTEFHSICDNKGPTLTLLYGQHNTLFGGYTSQNWSSNKKRTVRDENAFLFTKNEKVDAKCIFIPIKSEKAGLAITCDAEFGPTFGGGMFVNKYDLQTFKKDKKPKPENKDGFMHLNGTLNIGYTYRTEKDQPKIKTKDINSGKMTVKRIEVYQVVDDELPEPWLKKLEDKDDVRKEIMEMSTIRGFGVKQYNILLVGPIRAGKSSLVNTLSTVFTRKVEQIAQARHSITSVTSKVKAYVLKSESGEQLPIRIYDIRGFEHERGYGKDEKELELLLDGKLLDDYEFSDDPEHVPVQKEAKATLDDQIHLVCFVYDTLHSDIIPPELQKRFADIRRTVDRHDLPLAVVATKFDQVSPKISKDIDHIYRNPKAKSAVDSIAGFFGVPTKHVFPVVNYVSEDRPNEGIDRLALNALYEMCSMIEAHLGHQKGSQIELYSRVSIGKRWIVAKPDGWTERENLLPKWKDAAEEAIYLEKIHEKVSKTETKLRILVVGPVNSGKSSFIDSVSSTLRNQIEFEASGEFSASAQQQSVSSTEKFQMYPMKCKHGEEERKINVSFGDTPGFQEDEGVSVDHIKFILRGNVPNKYKIINGIQETKDFKREPTPSDKIHCVCFVFDCVAVRRGLSEKVICTMKNMQRIRDEEGIPYLVILTKCDAVSEKVLHEKCRIFDDKIVKECKDILMDKFRLKQQRIFPVVNYTHENNVDLQSDALLIAAYTEILKRGQEKLEKDEEEEEEEH